MNGTGDDPVYGINWRHLTLIALNMELILITPDISGRLILQTQQNHSY